MKQRRLAPLTALVCLLASAPDILAGSDEERGKTTLTRGTSPPDDDAKGKLKIRHDADKDRDRFDVEAEHLDPGLAFEAFLEDAVGAGTFTSIGIMNDGGESGEFELEFDSKDGDLPLGAALVADLIGRKLEIRNGGQVYLAGTVPAFAGAGSGKWQKARVYMTRPTSPPDDDAKGRIEVRKRDKDGRHRFELKAEKLPAGTYDVFMEDAVDSGTYVSVGQVGVSADGKCKFKVDTKRGDSLPFGVPDIDDLAGRGTQLRDNTDATFLQADVPSVSASQDKEKAKNDLDGSTGEGEIRIRSEPKKGNQEFRVKVKDQADDSIVELWVEDPSDNTLKLVASIQTNGGGEGRYRVRTKKGQALPFGVSGVSDLANMAIEIRERGTSTVLLSGTVPTF